MEKEKELEAKLKKLKRMYDKLENTMVLHQDKCCKKLDKYSDEIDSIEKELIKYSDQLR